MFTFLEYIIHNHLESIIALLITIICVVGAYVVYSNAFRKDENSQVDIDLSKIEESIERLLKDNAQSLAAGGTETVPATIIKELEEKKAEIEQLKAEGGGSGEGAPELLSKIKSLEDRLAEYEIIEDDIADLSKFKEENARLKRQLETLSAGGPAAAADKSSKESPEEEVYTLNDEEEAPAAEPEPESIDEIVPETSIEEAVEDAAPEISEEDQAKVSQALEELGAESIEDQDIPVSEPEASEEEAVVEDETPEEAPEGSEPEPSANVLAEMTEADEEGDEIDPLAALGDIDTDKMLNEIQNLSDSASASADVVKKKADLDKMASEAKKSGG